MYVHLYWYLLFVVEDLFIYAVTKQLQTNKVFDTYLADINKSDNTHDKRVRVICAVASYKYSNIIIIPDSLDQLSFSCYHRVSVVV